MTLEETNKIDLAREIKGKFMLGIVDAGITKDSNKRFELLIFKLRAYVALLASDNFRKENPKINPSTVAIFVFCNSEPTKQMKEITHFGLKDPTGKDILSVKVDFILQQF